MEFPREIETPRGTLVELSLPEHKHSLLASATTPYCIESITCTPVEFSRTDLPSYGHFFAVVLDNVFSPEECAIIRALPQGYWAPVSQGDAFREVDRTLVLNEQVTAVLYARVQPHLERLGVTRLRRAAAGRGSRSEEDTASTSPGKDWAEAIAGTANLKASQGRHKATWEMYAANERLSFLRYGPGMHHDRHCDQVFSRPGTGKEDKSFLTCQVYLSDAADPGEGEVQGASSEGVSAADITTASGNDAATGGTTRFWGTPGSPEEHCFVEVVPKAGRVLVFQQRMLWHSGEPVTAGQKFAMRTDLMYRRIFT
ncbi:2OG-Fe(II) oxygenase [Microdochium nivale]|nr:2OG-Fe(II) oxygenase [Microdochium nivale]